MLKIIISPAKKMNLVEDFPCEPNVPVFLSRAVQLHETLKRMDFSELKKLWGCSDRLALQNYERLHAFSPERALTPALLSYEGIQYQHIAPFIFTDAQWAYISSHLRILSGLYGILRPADQIIPYRLEMRAKLKTASGNDLYSYWNSALYTELLREGTTELINLASREYSKAVLPRPFPEVSPEHTGAPSIRSITCVFGELTNGKVRTKGTQAKIARGEMVRWMAENQIRRGEELRQFAELDYKYREDLSRPDEYVFIRS